MALQQYATFVFGRLIYESQINYDKLKEALVESNILNKDDEIREHSYELLEYLNTYIRNNYGNYPLKTDCIADAETGGYFVLRFQIGEIEEESTPDLEKNLAYLNSYVRDIAIFLIS